MGKRLYPLIKLDALYQKCLDSLRENSLNYSQKEVEDYLAYISTNPYIKDLMDNTYLTINLKSFLQNRQFFDNAYILRSIESLQRNLLNTARKGGDTVTQKLKVDMERGVITLESETPHVGGYEINKQKLRWRILKIFFQNQENTFSRAEIADFVRTRRGISYSKDIGEAIDALNEQFKKELGNLKYDILLESIVSNKVFYKLNTIDYEIV